MNAERRRLSRIGFQPVPKSVRVNRVAAVGARTVTSAGHRVPTTRLRSSVQPEGLAEGSRRLRSAERDDTPGSCPKVDRPQRGRRSPGIGDGSGTPPGCDSLSASFRRYRCAQPPATFCQPSGLKARMPHPHLTRLVESRLPLTRLSATLSPSDGERAGVRGLSLFDPRFFRDGFRALFLLRVPRLLRLRNSPSEP